MKKILSVLFLTLLINSISGCSSYKLEVQQGNVVPSEAVAKLKKGMSKAEVTSILGTPLLQDSFQTNRWDYIFYLSKAGKETQRKDLTLTFNGDRLAQIRK